MRICVERRIYNRPLALFSAGRTKRRIADDRHLVPRGLACGQNTPRRSPRLVPARAASVLAIGALVLSFCGFAIAGEWPSSRLGLGTWFNPSESTISLSNVSGLHEGPQLFVRARRQQLRPNAVDPPTIHHAVAGPVVVPTTVPSTPVWPSPTTTTAPMPAPQPMSVVMPAPAPPTTTTTTDPGWNCTVGVEYLELHQAPGFIDVCPASLPIGQAALTCVDMVPACPGVKVIEISDPTCAAAYENEASNSWSLQGLSAAPIDPFGPCFIP